MTHKTITPRPMPLRAALSTAFIAAALTLSACGGASKVKIDSTDGVTLDGTFQEAIEGLGKADQMKASAGLLMLAYTGADEDNRPMDYVQEAKEEASFLLMEDGGNIFQSRGSALDKIARESGGVLDGKTAQDLIDHYNLTTGQYDEYLKDKEEAKAAEIAERDAKEAAADAKRAAKEAADKAKKAAAAASARLAAIASQKESLTLIQNNLAVAVTTNKDKRDALKKAYDKALADKAANLKKKMSMVKDVKPAKTLRASSSGWLSGQVTATIVNTADAPIMNPVVRVEMRPKGSQSPVVARDNLRLYNFEQKGKPLAVGASSPPMYFPFGITGKGLPDGFPKIQGKDFSGASFQAYMQEYQLADKTKVSLKLDPKVQSLIDNYPSAVAKCDAADKAITNAKTAIPAALKALDAADADPKATPKLGATTC